MRAIDNFNEIKEAGSFNNIPAGGYVCKITDIRDDASRSFLVIEYDIAEGEYKDYWLDTKERAGFWGGSFVKSYTPKGAGFFKSFTNAVEKSNHNYKWNWDERTLVGKYVGLTIGEKEYKKQNGNIGTKMYVDRTLSVDDIKSGNFKIPSKITLPAEEKPVAPTFTAEFENDSDLPF